MTNKITVFNNEKFGQVRSVVHNNRPWLIGRDVAVALGYVKPENALATHVDKEDKTTTLIQGNGSNYKSKTVLINESGMYALIFGSKLETAKQFKHWVTSEVLPAIRKIGKYESKPADDYKARNLAVKEMNARSRQAQTLVRLAQLTQNVICREAMIAQAANTASGKELLPLPNLPAKTYKAEEIGAILGVSKQKIGRLANLHNLKTDEYGGWFADFVPVKGEVQTFRYYENVIPVLKSLIGAEVVV